MIEELKKIVTEEKDDIRRQYKAQIKAVFGSYARGDFHTEKLPTLCQRHFEAMGAVQAFVEGMGRE